MAFRESLLKCQFTSTMDSSNNARIHGRHDGALGWGVTLAEIAMRDLDPIRKITFHGDIEVLVEIEDQSIKVACVLQSRDSSDFFAQGM